AAVREVRNVLNVIDVREQRDVVAPLIAGAKVGLDRTAAIVGAAPAGKRLAGIGDRVGLGHTIHGLTVVGDLLQRHVRRRQAFIAEAVDGIAVQVELHAEGPGTLTIVGVQGAVELGTTRVEAARGARTLEVDRNDGRGGAGTRRSGARDQLRLGAAEV